MLKIIDKVKNIEDWNFGDLVMWGYAQKSPIPKQFGMIITLFDIDAKTYRYDLVSFRTGSISGYAAESVEALKDRLKKDFGADNVKRVSGTLTAYGYKPDDNTEEES